MATRLPACFCELLEPLDQAAELSVADAATFANRLGAFHHCRGLLAGHSLATRHRWIASKVRPFDVFVTFSPGRADRGGVGENDWYSSPMPQADRTIHGE